MRIRPHATARLLSGGHVPSGTRRACVLLVTVAAFGADARHDRVTDAVLAVGDGHLANVLWDGATCRLVDFEEFGTSDIAYEVADIVEHASSRLPRLLDIDSLLDGLQLDAGQQSRLVAYRQLMAAFWLVMLLPGNGGFTRNPPGSTEDQAEHFIAALER
jgi:hypothetical protein